jgi:uncharacterized repeat protein (TIGR02543 family)
MKKSNRDVTVITVIAAIALLGAGCNDNSVNSGGRSEYLNMFLDVFSKNPGHNDTGGGGNADTTRYYTLTVNITPNNGGRVSRDPDKASYSFGEPVIVTAVPADGYVFTGWSGASTSSNVAVTVTMDGNRALTAGFGLPGARRFTVYFNSNGGGSNPPAVTADSGNGITLPDRQAMGKDGYGFGGWNTSWDGTGTAYNEGESYTVTRDVTLFAVWTPISYTLTYTLNGATTTPSNSASYTIESASFALNNPTRTC